MTYETQQQITLEQDENSYVINIAADLYSQKYNNGTPVTYKVKQYAIGDGLFLAEGASPYDVPGIIDDVYVDDPDNKESINEKISKQEVIPADSSAVLIEVNNNTDDVVAVFTANSFDSLKVLYNVKDKSNDNDSTLNGIGEYNVSENAKSIKIPSFVEMEEEGEAESFSPAASEKVYKLLPRESKVIEIALNGTSKGKLFCLRASGIPLSDDNTSFFLMRVVGYRS